MTQKKNSEAGENPLVPNAKLRQMYTLMLEARKLEAKLLEGSVIKRTGAKKKGRIAEIRGQEAVRVSTAVELGPDDLVSDTGVSAGMALILGGDAASLLRGLARSGADGRKALADAGVNRVLDAVEDSEQRLRLVLGAASALVAQQRHGIVVVYARKDEVGRRIWRKTLQAAHEMRLPILFVALERGKPRGGDDDVAEVCEVANSAGVPGIPVDRCDAVALYRVTQESLGRTRNGDGPVLLECVSWRIKGKRKTTDDPIEHLQEFLLGRKICNRDWFKTTEKKVRKRLLKQRS